MAKIQEQVKYFIQRGNAFYWQPSTRLRLQGWKNQKLSPIRELAIQEAKALNQKLEDWYLSDSTINNGQENQVYTVNKLIKDFKASLEYSTKAEGTQKFYSIHLDTIKNWAGEYPVSALTRSAVKELYHSKFRKAPTTANGLMRTLRRLMYWGLDYNKITTNPAARIGIVNTDPRDRVGAPEEIAAMVQKADEHGWQSIGTGILMGFYLGQRESDIISMNWQRHFIERNDYAAIKIKQAKTQKWVEVPLAPELQERFEKINDRSGTILKMDKEQRAYNRYCFSKRFAKIRESLADDYPQIATLQFRDLRRTTAVRLAEADCSEIEIAAVTGHRIERCRQILEVYVPRTGKMAAAAIKKLTNAA